MCPNIPIRELDVRYVDGQLCFPTDANYFLYGFNEVVVFITDVARVPAIKARGDLGQCNDFVGR